MKKNFNIHKEKKNYSVTYSKIASAFNGERVKISDCNAWYQRKYVENFYICIYIFKEIWFCVYICLEKITKDEKWGHVPYSLIGKI